MKNLLVIIFTLAMSLILINPVAAVITGSAHDFSGDTWNTTGQICVVCHTPHRASMTVQPLWNHDETAEVYVDNITTSFGTLWGAANGPTLICLSCHDGTVALDSFGGTTGTNFIDPEYDVADGTLEGNHPVSIIYDETLTEFNTETAITTAGIKLYGAGPEMECGSCHNVHNTSGFDSLLRIDNAASTLCLTCHNK